MSTQITSFDYAQLDVQVADFLRIKERNMREIVGKSYTDLGRELTEARDKLSHNRNGVFDKWVNYIGMTKQQVSRLIHRYYMVTKCDDKTELLEDLPVSLSYEIASPSAESTEPRRAAKEAVLAGEVKTLKEYRELVAKLETAESSAEAERIARIEAEERVAVLADTVEALRDQPPIIETQTEYARDPTAEAEVTRYRERFGDIDAGNDGIYRIDTSTEVAGAALAFSADIRELLRQYSHLTHFSREFASLNSASAAEYRAGLGGLKEFITAMERNLAYADTDNAVIIDVPNLKGAC